MNELDSLASDLSWRVDPADLKTFDAYSRWLEAMLTDPTIFVDNDGAVRKILVEAVVARERGLMIEIHPNEHPPPHFHVRSATLDASFRIDDCVKLAGNIGNRDYAKVRYWHQYSKPILIEKWDLLRPTNCVVGPYRG
jgi:hypothetical protein